MQLKKLSLIVLGTTSLLTPVLNAASSDEVKFTQMKYEENQDRMKIDFSVLDFKKDFGTDYTFNMGLSYDTISGGTPVWDTISGASGSTNKVSNDPRCTSNPSLCKDLNTNSELLSNAEVSKDKFVYKNTNIDDTRKAVNLSLVKRTLKRDEITTGLAYSKEEDFKSYEASIGYLYNLNSFRNDSISVGLSYQQNEALHRRDNNKWKDFDVINFQVGYTKVLRKNLVAQVNYFASKQEGELSNPYQTVVRYFDISTSSFNPVYNYILAKEKRPKKRLSNGVSFDMAYKVHPKVSLHGNYRFYADDWGIYSNTFTINSYIEVLPKLTFIPLLRYYNQTQADFYKSHKSSSFHFDETSYASADERLSEYDSITLSLGLEYHLNKQIDINVIGARQEQSFGLNMNWASIGLKYRF